MKRTSTYLFLALSVTALSVGCRQRRTERQAAPAGKVFEVSVETLAAGRTDTLRVGTVREGEKVTLEFGLCNGLAEPFVIMDVKSGCGCTLFGYPRKPVPSGESAAMQVTFDSAGFRGEVVKEARVYISASDEPYRLIVEARVR